MGRGTIATPGPGNEAMMTDALEALADAIRQWRGPGVLAILAYGSCLRENRTDGIIDLYALTDSHRAVSPSRVSCLCAWALPPNVYYLETGGNPPWRAKVAVLPLTRFARLAALRTTSPYIWARFGQPSRIVWARGEDARAEVEHALATACATLWRHVALVSHAGDDALEALARLLAMTYGTELRPESTGRARLLVEADRGFFLAAAERHLGPDWRSNNATPHRWRLRRWAGKCLAAGRLLKGAWTFQGGADYMAGKVARHSDRVLRVSPWQRRHRVLGALALLPQIWRTRALH